LIVFDVYMCFYIRKSLEMVVILETKILGKTFEIPLIDFRMIMI
ncbi:unnamed protein product, partial [marine sediment metagenome]